MDPEQEFMMQQAQQKGEVYIPPAAEEIPQLNDADDDDGVVISQEVYSLRCPYSLKRLVHPGKSRACHHHDCFDVQLLMHLSPYATEYSCPLCKKQFHVKDVIIDPKIIRLLLDAPDDASRVIVDCDGNVSRDPNDDGFAGSDDDFSDSDGDQEIKPVDAPGQSEYVTKQSTEQATTSAAVATSTPPTNEPGIINLVDDDSPAPKAKRRKTSSFDPSQVKPAIDVIIID
jgi:hypothetical protein